MIAEKSIQSEITVLSSGEVQIKTLNIVEKDGEVLASNAHYNVISPGQDYSQEDAKVQAVCASVHTPEVIAAFQAQQSV